MVTAGQSMGFTRSKEDPGNETYGVPTGQGSYEIFPETMRSFPSIINYLNRYSALSAYLATPLSALTHQATDYKPGKV